MLGEARRTAHFMCCAGTVDRVLCSKSAIWTCCRCRWASISKMFAATLPGTKFVFPTAAEVGVTTTSDSVTIHQCTRL